MKGRALFVVHDVYQDDNDFPLGVAYLASVLRNVGVDVQVFCQDVFHYPNSALASLLETSKFDLIGVGFLAARFRETVAPLCDVINRHKKDALLVLGGHGPSPIPEYMLKNTQADIVVIGEAEETIVEIMEGRDSRTALEGIEGIAYRQGDEVVVNPRRRPIRELDTIPFPAWELFPMDRYVNCSKYPGQTEMDKNLAIISSRGCLGRCSFCYRMEKGIRWRSIENVVEEMKTLKTRYGVNYFCFQDELFLFKKSRLFEFEDALQKNSLHTKFFCDARADIFDEEMAECLKRIGCKYLNVGFESVDQKVLDAMHKGTTVEQNYGLAEIAHETGLALGLNFIWGSPCDTRDSLSRAVSFIRKFNSYASPRTIRPPTPYPGSPLYYEAIDRGLLNGPEEFFSRFRNSDLMAVNFTDMPDEECYRLLFAANKELTMDHYAHTGGSMEEAARTVQGFYDLYFRGKHDFRGARHYESRSE